MVFNLATEWPEEIVCEPMPTKIAGCQDLSLHEIYISLLIALSPCPDTSRLKIAGNRRNSAIPAFPRRGHFDGGNEMPLEDSSGNRRRLGHITKQVNSLVRFLLVEAAQVTARSLPEWRSKYVHLAMRRGRKIAKVAMARKLAVRLYWMMHKGWDYEQLKKFGSHAGQPGNRDGVKSNIE
jgi:hypothetical protein